MTGAGVQCRDDGANCRTHLEVLWQGPRSGLLVRRASLDDESQMARAGSEPGDEFLRGLSLMYRLTAWRSQRSGWSVAVHTLTGIGEGIVAAWLGEPSHARADMGVEWEFARHGPDGRPYITATLGLGLRLGLADDRPLPGTLRELRGALELTLQPVVCIRFAPFAFLGALL